MASRVFTSAEVREMSFGMQMFLFLALGQLYKYALFLPTPDGSAIGPHAVFFGALLFSPFIIAQVPPLLACVPRLLLRRESRVELHSGGLIFHYDSVKRPLFVEWADLAELERTAWGLRFEVRKGADVTRAMPSYQGQFWRARTARPVAIKYLGRWQNTAALRECLSAAIAAGVRVSGFEVAASGDLQSA